MESWKNLAHVGVNFQDLTFEQAVEKAAKMRKQILSTVILPGVGLVNI